MADADSIFENPPWHALLTEHAHFAIAAPRARKYPADVAPFAGTVDNTPESLEQLRDLMADGETVHVVTDRTPPVVAGLTRGEVLPCLQMIAGDLPEVASTLPILELSVDDAAAMVRLTDLAFPGFFRPRTHLMGAYYGIRLHGELIAMGGGRLAPPGWREISAVCTHPAHTGKGYAAGLIRHLMRAHRTAGLQSFLHVASRNARAISLYRHLGFTVQREISLHSLSRNFAHRNWL